MNKKEQLVFKKNSFLEKELAAKNRELEIEASLERVREKAMAMHASAELKEVVQTLFEELKHLDVNLQACLIATFDAVTSDQRSWIIHSKTNEPYSFLIPYNEQPFYQEMLKAWKEKNVNWSYILEGEAKTNWENFLFTDTEFKLLPGEVKEEMGKPEKVFFAASYYPYGAIQASSPELLSKASIDILQRFSKVFDSCYTRFLDLQKAESQAREAQVQLALERVRAKTMAMQKPSEFVDVINVIGEQFIHLGFDFDWVNFSANGLDVSKAIDIWNFVVVPGLYQGATRLVIPFFEHPVFKKAEESVNEYHTSGNSFTVVLLGKKDKDTFLDHLFTNTIYKDLPEEVKTSQYDGEVYQTINVVLKDTWLSVGKYDAKPFTDEQAAIIKRLATAFGQAYTRFLDLQKAEAQAREAQIEAALEKVRSRSLAMHKSDELREVIVVVFEKLKELGLVFENAGIQLFVEKSKDILQWVAAPDLLSKPILVNLPYEEKELNASEIVRDIWLAKEKNKNIFNKSYSLIEKNKFFKYAGRHNSFEQIPQQVRDIQLQAPGYTYNLVAEKHAAVWLDTYSFQNISVEDFNVLKRVAKVFEQAYTRFLDLQKAEAQAREAHIEAALEKVRLRTMAMRKSDELSEVAILLFNQVKSLGIKTWTTGFNVWSDNNNYYTDYITSPQGGFIEPYTIDATHFAAFAEISHARKTGEEFFVSYLEGDILKQTYLELAKFGDRRQYEIMLEGGFEFPSRQFNHFVFGSKVSLMFITYEPVPEAHDIFKRFGKVFEQTYTRFLDLQKAEAQAREAQIEAALERVRAKAMAMHNSNDVSIAASMVFSELRKLGIDPIRCGVGLLNKESRKAQLYSATSTSAGDSLSLVGWVILSGHPVLENIYAAWLKNEDYYPELTGTQLKSYYENLLAGLSLPTIPKWQTGEKQYGHFFSFSVGCLYAWSDRHYNESETKILKRFATIIDLTFRRYIDLQKAEANAKEAVKQSALDRIRADIASMRTISDLDRITPLIWNELTILGVPFIRCGVFIMDDEEQQIHTFLSTPEGKGIAAFHLGYKTPGNIAHVITHWQKKEIYTDRWDEEAFKEFADNLVQQGAMKSSEQYLSTMPAGGFNLHFVPFQQGMLYVGNIAPLDEEEINLLQSIADAFSTAYARYEDFNKLDAAKKQVDKTLAELRQTQQQLVQSEKMASLGELTAGIAHEIQNPLNFVNNFSEVNREMLEELKTERSKPDEERDDDSQNDLINDVIENSEKILHHGKRADAIVKGMLQHSRKSSGQKEPTDINALADEYLRLSYHGMRAKDKSFNAEMKTDFDESLGKINIIPQDIGRVLLNLFNNAFYAVNEKQKAEGEKQKTAYTPTILLTTKKSDGHIEIHVKDNGNGIPQKILDKIFHPFFTTKPTGEGTGLGLSLSYDIIKAHGGEIKVESKEGEGTEFIIQIAA